jgi:O-antigen/teichoic acid export membrane protein
MPIFCVLIIMGKDFITLWIGVGYNKSYQVLVILVSCQFLILTQYGLTIVLYGLAKHDILAYINITIAILNIILSIVLLHYWGIIGVAVGTIIPLTTLRLGLIPKHVLNIIQMRFKIFWNKIIVPGLLLLLTFSIVLIYLKNMIKTDTWLRFFSTLGTSLIFYIIIFYFIFLTRNEKNKIKNYIFTKLRELS